MLEEEDDLEAELEKLARLEESKPNQQRLLLAEGKKRSSKNNSPSPKMEKKQAENKSSFSFIKK